MRQILLLALAFASSYALAKDTSQSPHSIDEMLDFSPKNYAQEELLLTELDDMKNLFLFSEQLDPLDPSLCIETIAKKQQEDFIRSQDLTDLNRKDKH